MLAIKLFRRTQFPSLNLKQFQHRKLHKTPAPLFAIKFKSSEITYNYQIVQKFAPLIRTPIECKQIESFEWDLSCSDRSTEELVNAFETLSHHCKHTETCISDDKFDGFIEQLVKKIHTLSDDQLMKVLADLERFPQTQNTYSKNFHELWMRLDEVCYERVKEWNQQILLKFCNLWLKLHLSKVGKFTAKALTKVCRRIDRLNPKDLVEAMFYVTVCRSVVVMADVESRFFQIFDQLNIDEIGIMCLAFFKTETKVRTAALIDKLYDKTVEDIDEIQDITIVNILKTLRYSSDPSHASRMKMLSDALLWKVDNYSLTTCLHIGLLGTNLQYCHQELLETIVKRYNNEIKAVRLKDIERVTFVLGLFDFKTQSGVERELLSKIVDELKLRVDEVVQYPKCLAACAHYLTICGFYDVEIMKTVLAEKFINFAYGRFYNKVGREVLCLDSFAKIQLKDTYDGPALQGNIGTTIAKNQSHYIPYEGQPYKMTHADKLLLDIKLTMEDKYGENMLTHILPHYQRPDIVYCFDANGKSVTKDIIKCFPPPYRGQILSKEYLLSRHNDFAQKMDQIKMVAVVLGGWNFYIRDSRKPTGGLRMKIEQLEIIGYKPILIHYDDWASQPLEFREKLIDQEIKRVLSSKDCKSNERVWN